MKQYKVVLSIAGSDSCAGAGLQADIKTAAAIGCYATTVVTAVTAQNTVGVQMIHDVPPEVVTQQLTSVARDIPIAAVKIAMLSNHSVIDAVSNFLAQLDYYCPVVIDPVMVAQSGDKLLTAPVADYLQQQLFTQAYLLTPNIPEAQFLANRTIDDYADMKAVAKVIAQKYKTNVLLKGGHLPGDVIYDVLYIYKSGILHSFESTTVHTNNNHGTGCSLSTAICAYLSRGCDLLSAVDSARIYVFNALLAGVEYNLGRGAGPLKHM